MNKFFVVIVPRYALVVQLTVMWSRYRFIELNKLLRLKQLSLNVMSHSGVDLEVRLLSWETRLGNHCYPSLVTAANFWSYS